MTLKPYQYQLGSCVFGRNTDIPISKVDLQPYNVNAQDFQVSRTDENRFGIDTLVPAPIVLTMATLENFMLNDVPDSIIDRGANITALAKEWKSRDLRATWGQVVPLRFCDGDGVVKRIYGRPGKFVYAPRVNNNTMWIDVQAEFRRGDTYSYSDVEYFVGDAVDPANGMQPGAAPVTATRLYGDANSWVRFLFIGPMTHPLVTYGGNTIELNVSIAAGVSLEVSSYPWSRRVVDSQGINWRSQVIGNTEYLDQIFFEAEDEIPVSWTCTGSTATTQMYFLWREAQNVL